VLLNFNSKRRLLLTGTPLQNNLMELWSLLYFLMPNGVSQDMPVGFANLKEFQEWFTNPVDRAIENNQGVMDEESRAAIQKLHTVLRPYLLRRLKVDVEKQMPEKHEHIVYCRLSKRQRYLYDDFMSRAKTKETLVSGSFLNIINCLMQLRKVCNHPDLFEERPILTSFAMTSDIQESGQHIMDLIQKRLLERNTSNEYMNQQDLSSSNLIITRFETVLTKDVAFENRRLDAMIEIAQAIAKHEKCIHVAESRGVRSSEYHNLLKYTKYREMQMHAAAVERLRYQSAVNHIRCNQMPIYGIDLIRVCQGITMERKAIFFAKEHHDSRTFLDRCEPVRRAVQSYKARMESNQSMLENYGFVTPKVVLYRPRADALKKGKDVTMEKAVKLQDIFHSIESRLSIAFPDKRLVQYDCGKLQKLDMLLRKLKQGGHRALIFTQMTRVLDVLETFLNMHGHRYLRLDGATKVEQRQVLTEHFNADKRILCFILSTRSGGLGINLTGADTVIFYDSDWNPSMVRFHVRKKKNAMFINAQTKPSFCLFLLHLG
jgi:helicase SWR1